MPGEEVEDPIYLPYSEEQEAEYSFLGYERRIKRVKKLENAFSLVIAEAKPPEKFKILILESYKGRTDPYDHISYFESAVSLLTIDDVLKCRLFFTNFKESALRWFTRLAIGVFGLFPEFRRIFLAQFTSAQKPMKNSQTLLRMKQEAGESLQSYHSLPELASRRKYYK